MTYEELITVCKLKGRVRKHKRIYVKVFRDGCWVTTDEKRYKVLIQSRRYEVSIWYNIVEGEFNYDKNTLVDCKDTRVYDNVSEEQLTSYLLGPNA